MPTVCISPMESFYHESPRRGPTFVTRKISRAVARIHMGRQKEIFLGNLDAKRDWGHAKDYVKGMWLMLQQDEPEDYVLATGETNTVRRFVECSFAVIGIKILWRGEGVDEEGYDEGDPERTLVRIDPRYFRPTEVDILKGDATKAFSKLGWKPSTNFLELVSDMVYADIALLQAGVQE